MMTALLAIGWFVALLASVAGIYATWGDAQLTDMFPEGKRWWGAPTKLLSLVAFASVVLFHPFAGLFA